ncbi:lysine-specific demethylase JMJ13-like [Humulus lupulus]|uniref:lysine-specific demethylase JMJ13-like n=1 Tax=Humulus lupulus TaxID=3486 RepID=UPI002B407E7C|nr:lysine-specific demethylase JMJ13-like [Humulus lupulus]
MASHSTNEHVFSKKKNTNNKRTLNEFDLQWIEKIPKCPIYHPTVEEFDDPLLYLQTIAPHASKYGICKIVSPIKACVPANVVLSKEMKGFKFETNVQPLRIGSRDPNDKFAFFKRGRKYSFKEFESMADKVFVRRFRSSDSVPSEQDFWHEMLVGRKGCSVEYGVNVEGSAFSSDPNDNLGRSKWNLKNLSRLPNSTLRLLDRVIPGITDPMLYIGMLYSMFAWHVEDHYLYSINYHHSGAPKTWYGVPADFASRFENAVLNHVYNGEEVGVSKLLAEKTTMFPPSVLLQNNVPVYKAIQKPGEFVITFPKAYHSGFSHGFNCGEAVNFAIGDWFPFGGEARQSYALLRVSPIIPYEELLCKEAMLLHNLSPKKEQDLASHFSIKLSFVCLVRFLEQDLWRLSRILRRSSSSVWSTAQDTKLCSRCYRDCYLAYLMCSSCPSYSLCLSHVWDAATDWIDCPCGNQCNALFLRDDMSTYENVARVFEQEDRISMEIREEMKNHEFRASSKDYTDFKLKGKSKLRGRTLKITSNE